MFRLPLSAYCIFGKSLRGRLCSQRSGSGSASAMHGSTGIVTLGKFSRRFCKPTFRMIVLMVPGLFEMSANEHKPACCRGSASEMALALLRMSIMSPNPGI